MYKISRILSTNAFKRSRRLFNSTAYEIEEYDFKKFCKYMFFPAVGFGGKYMAGDAIAQSLNDQTGWDLKRNLQWGAFGLTMSLFFYSPMWTRIFPRYIARYKYGNIGVAGFQTFIFEPFVFMPCFYSASAVFNHEFEKDFATEVFQKWKSNFKTDMTALTLYGVPVFGLNATVVPINYRSWFVTLCGIVFSAVIIYFKVDVTTEDIILPRNAVPLLLNLELTLDFRYSSTDREVLLRVAQSQKGISFEEFRKYCEKNYPEWTLDSIKHIFVSMDTDGNGTVDFEEAKAWFRGATVSTVIYDREEKLLEWFNSMQKTTDGCVDKEEICNELRKWFKEDSAIKMFEQIDEERDGVISMVEFKNFLELRRRNHEYGGPV